MYVYVEPRRQEFNGWRTCLTLMLAKFFTPKQEPKGAQGFLEVDNSIVVGEGQERDALQEFCSAMSVIGDAGPGFPAVT